MSPAPLKITRAATLIILPLAAAPAAAQLSTFDSDNEGWSTLNDATNLTWDAAVGNPPGAIHATDLGQGDIWYFSAPAPYLGNQVSLYTGSLNWDILGLTGNQTSLPGRADVILTGGGFSIGIAPGVQPVLGQWTSWSVPLDAAAADWREVSSLSGGTLSATPVTGPQFLAILSDLTAIHIRGEYTNTGGDRTALDNVALIPAPGAATLALLALSTTATRRRR